MPFTDWLTNLFRHQVAPPLPRPKPKPRPRPAPDPVPIPPPDLATITHTVAVMLNAERAIQGLTLLKQDAKLDDIAQKWADYNAATDLLDHGDFLHRVAGAFPDKAVAENIAEGQVTPRQVVNDWMQSDGHRRNILNPVYRLVGVGMAKSRSGQSYWTADFES